MTEAVRDRLLRAVGHALLFIIKRTDEYAVFGSAYTELKEALQLSEQEPDAADNKPDAAQSKGDTPTNNQ